MRIAGFNANDTGNGEGICVSLFVQGCNHHCLQCFNKETWDFHGGMEVPIEIVEQKIIEALTANGIQRNFSLLGGEPLHPNNIAHSAEILEIVKYKCPLAKTFVWTGYTYEELRSLYYNELAKFLSDIDVLIDGRFEINKRDISLKMRGSTNQRLIDVQQTLKQNKIVLYSE
ncbi:MAG: anaerobic ribonucleoside-triphosphate reductase activating protein, partial [Prevotella sp.]|nr:anaerobic ribonucleoside-triphosphate reductase activating protein [Prevotella sp.]